MIEIRRHEPRGGVVTPPTALKKRGAATSRADSSSTKKSTELTLIDKLSRLSYQQTLRLLGSDAPRLLRAGSKWNFRIEEDVYLGPELFRLKFPPAAGERESERVIVMISMVESSYNR